ncbi:MAG: hypothetical protein DMD33_14110 [Gemmatimonadetes bacterium]|nr:MAG: hypothetical protein DMD33_14110 [Gemmatimonadota bacterium]
MTHASEDVMEHEHGNGDAAPRAPLGEQERLRLATADWMRSFRWTVWATPSFAHAVTRRYALHAVRAWLRKISRESYAIVSLERGPSGLLWHPHALVGGIPRSPLVAGFVGGLWRHGNVEVAPYDRRLDHPGTSSGASWYLTKTGTDAVEILGSPIVYRPRRRGGGSAAQRE